MSVSANNNIAVNGFLISGASAAQTGTLPFFGMKSFSVLTEGVFGNGGNANGTFALQGRLHPDSSWINLQNITFTNSSGVLYQFNGPFESLRARLSVYNSGVFNVVYCVSEQ